MIKAIVFDFAKVLLFAKDPNHTGRLNPYWSELSQKPDFKFFDFFTLNEELLGFIKQIRENGTPVYIFTSETIQEDPAVVPILAESFDRIVSALRSGTKKDDPEAYKKMLQELNLKPAETIYVDDKGEFVDAAKSAGLNAFKYESNPQIIPLIKEAISL